MNLTITPATLTDATDLVAAQVASFHSDAQLYDGIGVGGPPGYDSVEAMRQDITNHDTYTIREGGRIVGGMRVIPVEAGHYWLGVIFIAPAYHNRGIGTRAMRFIEDHYPDATRISLETPQWATRNHHFYEKLGYQRVGINDDGETPLYIYEKRID